MLDLIRLGEGRWLARAVTRFDGEAVVIEEILECDSLPLVEAVIEIDAGPPVFVLRRRDEPSVVLAARQLEMTDAAGVGSAPA